MFDISPLSIPSVPWSCRYRTNGTRASALVPRATGFGLDASCFCFGLRADGVHSRRFFLRSFVSGRRPDQRLAASWCLTTMQSETCQSPPHAGAPKTCRQCRTQTCLSAQTSSIPHSTGGTQSGQLRSNTHVETGDAAQRRKRGGLWTADRGLQTTLTPSPTCEALRSAAASLGRR